MKELTKAEDEIMQVLWQLDKAFVKEIIEKMPDPKPAYNTVSTIVRILEQKGFVSHTAFGKSHRYFPTISKLEYSQKFMKGFISRYFSGSYQQLVSFFAKENDLSVQELEEVLKQIKSDEEK